MGLKVKICIAAVGVMAGVYYFMHKRKKSKLDQIKELYKEALEAGEIYPMIENIETLAYMFDEYDSPSDLDSFDLDYDDSDSSFNYDDVDDYMLDLEDEIRASELSIGYFGQSARPRFNIARKRIQVKKRRNKKKSKKTKKVVPNREEVTFNEECPICTDTFNDSKPYVTLDCKHRLHNACTFRMVRSVKNLACPLCRQQVEIIE